MERRTRWVLTSSPGPPAHPCVSSFPEAFLSPPQKSSSFRFCGQFVCLFDPTAVSCEIPLALWIVYAGPLCCHRPAGARGPGVAPEEHHTTDQTGPGREHSSREAFASSENSPGPILSFFFPDGDAFPLMCCTSAVRERTLLPLPCRPPTPACWSNSSQPFGETFQLPPHPPPHWSLTCISALLHFSFSSTREAVARGLWAPYRPFRWEEEVGFHLTFGPALTRQCLHLCSLLVSLANNRPGRERASIRGDVPARNGSAESWSS